MRYGWIYLFSYVQHIDAKVCKIQYFFYKHFDSYLHKYAKKKINMAANNKYLGYWPNYFSTEAYYKNAHFSNIEVSIKFEKYLIKEPMLPIENFIFIGYYLNTGY